jgi:WD40 repeat protein
MSLMGLASETVGIISALQSKSVDKANVKFFEFLHDAYRFLLRSIRITNIAPLQVYCSGLAFSPTDSIIRETFKNQRPSWIPVLPQVEKSWSAELQTLEEGHSGWVESVTFSLDGQRIVSGSGDHTIKLRDAQTGSVLRTFEGHSDTVSSVAFSPNGQRIASGSGDHTIKLWDAQTGSDLRSFEGHSDWVNSVAFSPDGQRIVSGSGDQTIKLWDAQTGSVLRTFEDHPNWVNSVAFSPNGQRIVSGSRDHTIKLWDAHTGSVLRSLVNPWNPVSNNSSDKVHVEDDQSSLISVENNWVCFRGQRRIWLPPELRGPVCHDVSHKMLALGYENGRVLVITLCPPSD